MRSAPLVLAALATAVTLPASADQLTQQRAIAVAKAAAAKECSPTTPCTFEARREGNVWHVFVTFTKRFAPEETPRTYPGGHEIIVIHDAGKVVGTMPGE